MPEDKERQPVSTLMQVMKALDCTPKEILDLPEKERNELRVYLDEELDVTNA